jgi:hypothetical protein
MSFCSRPGSVDGRGREAECAFRPPGRLEIEHTAESGQTKTVGKPIEQPVHIAAKRLLWIGDACRSSLLHLVRREPEPRLPPCWDFVGTGELTRIRLTMLATPLSRSTAVSTSIFWNCQSTSPDRVTIPFSTMTWIRFSGRPTTPFENVDRPFGNLLVRSFLVRRQANLDFFSEGLDACDPPCGTRSPATFSP